MNMFLFVSILGIAMILFAATRGKDKASLADKELEITLHEFMDEFEKEHKFLLQSIRQLQQDVKSESETTHSRFAELEAKLVSMPKPRSKKSAPVEETTPAIIFNARYSRVVEMARDGRTPEQISKDTEIGLGEIQMVLNLAKQGNVL